MVWGFHWFRKVREDFPESETTEAEGPGEAGVKKCAQHRERHIRTPQGRKMLSSDLRELKCLRVPGACELRATSPSCLLQVPLWWGSVGTFETSDLRKGRT